MSSGIYKIIVSKQAVKDAKLIKQAQLENKVKTILSELSIDPYSKTFNFEALKFDLSGFYSKRINIKHRLVYRIDETRKEVIILRMWSHYEKM